MDRQYGSITRYDEGDFRILRTDDDGNLCVAPPSSGLPYQFFLSSNGLQTGTIDAIGNYSASPTDFYYTASARFEIYSLIVNISDSSKFNQVFYGGMAAGLTNGIKFFADIGGGIELPLLRSEVVPVKQNFQWLSIASRADLTSFDGTAQTLSVYFNILDSYGRTFQLDAGQTFIVRLNDDFTGLTGHTFILRGTLFT